MGRDKLKQSEAFRAWYAANRDRVRASQKVWRSSERGLHYQRNRTLRKHGIDQARWDSMWQLQSGKCAGCLVELAGDANTHIDHCHSTGLVRGILCSACNLALGKVRDNPATLRRLAAYLEHNNGGRRG